MGADFTFDSRGAAWQRAAAPAACKGTEAIVVKPEWGLKRICPNCGTRYYDMQRDPITCPRCSAPFDPEAFKARRVRVPAPTEAEPTEPMADEEIDADLETEETGAEGEEEEALPIESEEGGEEGDKEEEEEEEVIEDASELGEDEDDMAEVIENVEDEDDR
jgi:uncharacterized protein (TIGR02300 family)